MQTNEELKPIEGYEGLYSVDRKGNVFSHKSNKYLSLGDQNDIYHYSVVGLYKDGKVKMFCVHKLVARTFIPNPKNLPIANHKDGNKKNNCVENLEWCSQKENVAHALANDLKGRKNEARKIKWIP